MRFRPDKRWKKIVLSTLLTMLVVAMALVGYLEYSVYREVSSPLDVLNSNGAKRALIIYHPGLTDYARNITYSYAAGLVSSGWRVDIVTANSNAPTDLSGYSLLVLGWPIYDFNPGPTITNQIHRMGDLNGTDTVILVIAGGMDPFNAQAKMQKLVQDANGTLKQTLQAFRGENAWETIQNEAGKIKP